MKISPKSGNIMITGGDDRKIKLWIIGKLKSLAVIFYLVYIFIILKDKQKKKKKKKIKINLKIYFLKKNLY